MYNERDRHKEEKDEYKELFDSIKDIENEEEYFEEITKLIGKILNERTKFVKNSDNEENRNKVLEIIKLSIKKVYRNNNCKGKISDNIEFIGSGHTALAFRIGNEVLKVGKKNYDSSKIKKEDLPCLIPLTINESYKIDTREFYTIEVSPYVDIIDITEEELYKTYKALRKCGYIWNDPRVDNVGMLKNDFEYNGIKYQKGDIVIIDLEDIAYVGETTSDEILEEISIASYNPRTYRFETRYINEKSKTL